MTNCVHITITVTDFKRINRMKSIQVIYMDDEFCEVDKRDKGIDTRPSWPIQDEYGGWHWEEFNGQAIYRRKGRVSFGFMAYEIEKELIERDKDGTPFLYDNQCELSDGRYVARYDDYYAVLAARDA